MPLPRPTTVVAIVPHSRVDRFIVAGWKADGRSNAHTRTMSRRFDDETQATRFVRKADCIAAVEVER